MNLANAIKKHAFPPHACVTKCPINDLGRLAASFAAAQVVLVLLRIPQWIWCSGLHGHHGPCLHQDGMEIEIYELMMPGTQVALIRLWGKFAIFFEAKCCFARVMWLPNHFWQSTLLVISCHIHEHTVPIFGGFVWRFRWFSLTIDHWFHWGKSTNLLLLTSWETSSCQSSPLGTDVKSKSKNVIQSYLLLWPLWYFNIYFTYSCILKRSPMMLTFTVSWLEFPKPAEAAAMVLVMGCNLSWQNCHDDGFTSMS